MSHPFHAWPLIAVALLAGCEDTYPLSGLAPPPCTFDGTGGFCGAGPCEVVVPPGALQEAATISIRAVDAEGLHVPAIGERLCEIGPPEVTFAVPAELRMAIGEDEIAEGFDLFDLVGFTVADDGTVTRAASTDAQPTFSRVAIPITGAARAGATIVPSDIELVDELGKVDLDITDAASYLRNLSTYPFRGVFFDGRRLYVGNGPRVLVWNDGVPAHGLVPPDLVLGKRDLEDDSTVIDAANLVGNVEDIWSDGERVVVSAGHRVLIWEREPTESGAPADLVLGQETFNTNSANLGGRPTAQTLFTPDEIASDGTRLLVADTSNHRVLVWTTFPRLFAQPADLVIGQAAFDDNDLRAGAIPFYQPRGVYLDDQRILVSSSLGCTCAFGVASDLAANNPLPEFSVGPENGVRRVTPTTFSQPSSMHAYGDGGLALRDASGARVSLWRTFPEAPDTEPDLYVGKPDGTIGGTDITGVSASSLTAGASAEGGVYADRERLIVADETRVLIWRSLPEANHEPADLVIGQPGTTTALSAIDYGGVAADSLAHPAGLSTDGDTFAIADRSNHRVSIVRGDRTVVVGQANAEQFLENRGESEARADTLAGPTHALLHQGRLVVVDSGNHRVLVWNAIPTQDGAPADHVIGQADFSGRRPNRGRPDDDKDGDRDADADTLRAPTRAFAVGDRLFVSDTENHRVVVYEDFTSAQVASDVIGQPDFTSNDPNRGGGWYVRGPDGFALPEGLFVEGGDLYVADRENNRVLQFRDVTTTDDVADVVFGQADFTTDAAPSIIPPPSSNRGLPFNAPQLVSSALTLRRPRDVRVLGGRVFVADGDNHRVVGYTPPFDAPPFAAALVIGQEDFEEHVANADGIGPASLDRPTALATKNDRLLVSDTDNHRVLAYPLAALVDGTRPSADEVFGQIDTIGHGINKSAQSPGLLSNPTSVAHDGQYLWVVDRDHHRVVAYADDEPLFALGQPDVSRGLANAGGEPDAGTLSSPTDVYADEERLIVADRHNHRVLIWSPPPTTSAAPADLVIGQASFEASAPNAGRGIAAAGPDGLNAPEGIDYEDGRLYVADTGNSRVLVFEAPFANGMSASDVWCQTGFTENRSNRGRGAPDADTCAAPRDVTFVDGALYIADTLNNRVLVTGLEGGPAVRVLGQQDFTTRLQQDVSAWAMASPVSVAYDGSNLLVSDTGHHRVLVYALLPGEDGAAADAVIGQRSFESPVPSPEASGLRSPSRVALVPLEFNDTRVYVADTSNNRIAVYRGLARLDVD